MSRSDQSPRAADHAPWRVSTTALRTLILALALTTGMGCEALPRDSSGSFEKMRSSGVLRVGAAAESPFVEVEGSDVRGLEAELVLGFSQRHGARVVWSTGSQTGLAKRLHSRELDVLIGGLDKKTPLQRYLALSRPYASTATNGSSMERVLAVMPGESRLLFEIDRFLLEDPIAVKVRRHAEGQP